MAVHWGGRGPGHLSRLAKAAGGVLALPSGAIGVWDMSDYQSSPRVYVPNTASTYSAPLGNYINAPRRLFSKSEFYNVISGTAADDAATGADGVADASTLNLSAGGYMRSSSSRSLAAGTYTVAISAKRNAASDQVFKLYSGNSANLSATQTATSAWQDFSFTFTLASPAAISTIGLITNDGATAANLQIRDFRIFAGSSDLGVEAPVGHLLPGIISGDSLSSYASGELDLSGSNGCGVIQLPSAISTDSGITLQAVCNKTATGTTYEGAFSKITSFSAFTAWYHSSSANPVSFNSSGFNTTPGFSGSQSGGLFEFYNKGYHILTWRYDHGAGVEELFVDDMRLFYRKASLSATTLRDLWLGGVNVTTLPSKRKYAAAAIWNRALSDAEIAQSFDYWKGHLSVSVTGDTDGRYLAAEGDSITAESSSYAYQSGPNLTAPMVGSVWAISSSSLANLNTRASYVDGSLVNATGSATKILSVLIGANGLAGYSSAAQYITDLAAYCDARRAAGWKVVVCTILPIDGNATHNSRRATVNAAITTWVGVHCDAIADFAANAQMGPDNSRSLYPALWTDATHPTTAGHTVLEPIYRAAVNAL